MSYIKSEINNDDNDNDNDNEKEKEKIIIPKKNYYCSNCNRKGHTYKNCLEPIISNGIIGIYIENSDKYLDKNFIELLENYIINNLKIFSKYSTSHKNGFDIWLENLSKIDDTKLNNDIKFLMIQRKNSLGYLEFIRGRYNINESNSIIHLIEQMSPSELDDIINKDFDYLWNELWDKNNIKNKNHHKEFLISKQKFYELRLMNIDLLTNAKTLFNYNEWGFPKGRREPYESDLVCAIREFEEETSYNENKYILLEKCKLIRENLIGTNGIEYAHNYFLTVLIEKNEEYDKSNREIGDVKIMNLNDCIDITRPYHKNKIKIMKYIYNVINDFMIEYDFTK
jgi:8-oxo-dGTP pyrophosphatase MutT (NUDIX family)